MAKRTNSNGAMPEPVFDYSNYSRKKQKLMARFQMKLTNLAQRLSDYEQWSDEDAFEAALDRFDELQNEFAAHIIKYVVSVPREWLATDAPASLDWNDPDSLDWLRADKQEAFVEMATSAQRPESVSGN